MAVLVGFGEIQRSLYKEDTQLRPGKCAGRLRACHVCPLASGAVTQVPVRSRGSPPGPRLRAPRFPSLAEGTRPVWTAHFPVRGCRDLLGLIRKPERSLQVCVSPWKQRHSVCLLGSSTERQWSERHTAMYLRVTSATACRAPKGCF